MDSVSRRKILGLAGLGLRGRLAVVGVQQTRDSARRGRLKIALVADDASQNSRDRIVPLLSARKVTIVRGFSAGELGAAAGRDSVAVLGVTDAGLARGIREAAPEDALVVTAGDTAPRRVRH